MNFPKLFNVKQGDMLTIAGRQFLVYHTTGTGLSMELTLITNRIFMSKGGPTNRLKCTWDQLIDRLIVVHKKIDKTV
jgi:hypothetical protein